MTLLPRALGVTVLLAGAALALTPMLAYAAELEVGQPAPDFNLPDQNGKMHHLADYRGKTVIIAMYPKDMTPG